MSAEVLSTLTARSIALTPKGDTQGVKIRLKVYWKTRDFWTDQHITKYRQEAPAIAKRLKDNFAEWRSDGSINHNFATTCEDFAIRVLVVGISAQRDRAFRSNVSADSGAT